MDDLRKLSDEEIARKAEEVKVELIKLDMKKASRQEFQAHLFKENRRLVARLLTIKREREIEQGISRRESLRQAKREELAKYKAALKEANVVIQRPKSKKLRWRKRTEAREEMAAKERMEARASE